MTMEQWIKYDNSDFHKVITRVVVAVIILDLQLLMQSASVTAEGVSSHLDQGEVYNIMW